MRALFRLIAAMPCLIATCAMFCAGQTASVHGHIFHDDTLGLTYTFPEQFSAKIESEMPMQDRSGREHMILALWNTSDRSGSPRMAFLYDRKVRPAGSSREQMAGRYLAAVRQLWVNV
jgi:hypothetical protein